MTEQDWLTATSTDQMYSLVCRKGLSERKHRLVACAWCRMVWNELVDERSRRVVEVTEQFLDGVVRKGVLEEARNRAYQAMQERLEQLRVGHLESDPFRLAWAVSVPSAHSTTATIGCAAQRLRKGGIVVAFYHDIFGNPFRPVTIVPTWLAANVVAIAQTIYDERRFQDMPILADALEDAGCNNADILNHCRQPGEHYRGCWLVDLLLGKKWVVSPYRCRANSWSKEGFYIW